MRTAQVKCIVHSSGTEVPLLCFGSVASPEVPEMIIPAMPFVTVKGGASVIRRYPGEDTAQGIDRIQFDFLLDFGFESVKNYVTSVYVYSGELTLWSGLEKIRLAHTSYHGIFPVVRFAGSFTINSEQLPAFEGMLLKNRFSYRHPDNPGKISEFEFSTPVEDMFTWSDFDYEAHIKRYLLDPEEQRYLEVTFPAKARNKPNSGLNGAIVLQRGERLMNLHAQALLMQTAKIPNAAPNVPVSEKLPDNKIQGSILIEKLTIIESFIRPEMPLLPADAEGIFYDWKDTRLIWCHDTLQVAYPVPGVPFSASPFQFLFRVKGMDGQGRPVLESEITLTLARTLTPPTAAYSGYSTRRIVPRDLWVSISIPYTDDNGVTRFSVISASTLTSGDNAIVARFILNNQWSRIAYAALSSDDVVSRDIRLSIRYYFQAYAKKTTGMITVISLNKIDRLQVVREMPRDAFGPPAAIFVSSKNTLISPSGNSVKFGLLRPSAAAAVSAVRPSATPLMNAAPVPQKPQNEPDQSEYKTQTLVYKTEFELSFPCADMGEYYQEEKDGQQTAIGCRQPYKLGEIDQRLFSEITQLSTSGYRILRSTQVPNRFAIVPGRYVVSRNSEEDPDPFSPAMIVYSTFDVNNPSASHAVISAILQPDVSHFKFLEIKEALRAYTSYEPDLQLITAFEGVSEFRWTLPESLYLDNSALMVGDLVNYSLSCTIANALTIINMLKYGRSGILGAVDFMLPDGSKYSSSVIVNVGEIEGPWMDSPLKITTTSLQNLMDAPVDIAGYYYRIDGKTEFENLNATLEKNAVCAIPADSREQIVPQCTVHVQEGQVSEVHAYLENINCQILFINTSVKDISSYDEVMVICALEGDHNAMAGRFQGADSPLEIILPVPLTRYLSQRTVQYRIRAKKNSGAVPVETDWQVADLGAGNIIDIGPIINLNL